MAYLSCRDESRKGLCWALVLCLFASLGLSQTFDDLVSPGLLDWATEQYGAGIVGELTAWGQLVMEQNRGRKDLDKLQAVNRYFNRKIHFRSDQSHWQQEDYWATPVESIGSGGGDCEDYVIAKYFSLIQAGVEQSRLRITYVKALKLNQAHMVLAYYATPNADPLILDNLTSRIEPASRRPDLSPVYSFNGLGMWLERMKGGSIRVGDPKRLNMWMDLLIRMEEQKQTAWLALPNRR